MNSPIPNGSSPSSTADRSTRLTQDARCTHVIETAVRLFAEKGFQGTKTKEVAEVAGVNEALIFRDFHTKEKLYCAILDYASRRLNAVSWIEELQVHVDRRDDEAVFSLLARRLLQRYIGEHNLFRLMLYSALEQHELARKFRERQIEPVQRFIEDYVRVRQNEGAFRSFDVHTTVRAFLDMCQHNVLRSVLFGDDAESTPERTATTLTELFLNGVRSH